MHYAYSGTALNKTTCYNNIEEIYFKNWRAAQTCLENGGIRREHWCASNVSVIYHMFGWHKMVRSL